MTNPKPRTPLAHLKMDNLLMPTEGRYLVPNAGSSKLFSQWRGPAPQLAYDQQFGSALTLPAHQGVGLNLGPEANPLSNFTFACWLRAEIRDGSAGTSEKNRDPLLEVEFREVGGRYNNGLTLAVGSGIKLIDAERRQEILSAPEISDWADWHHIALTHGDNIWQVVVDGEQVAEAFSEARIAVMPEDVGLENLRETGAMLAHIRLYAEPLTVEELRLDIMADMASGATAVQAHTHYGEGLLLHLPLDQAKAGQILDFSGQENHGTAVGEVNWVVDALFGNCVALAGAGGLQVSDLFQPYISPAQERFPWFFPAGFSLALWVYPDGDANGQENQILFDVSDATARGRGFTLGMDGGRPFAQDGYSRGKIVSPSPLPARRWTHLALTYDGRYTCFYRDGELVGDPLPSVERIDFRHDQQIGLGYSSSDDAAGFYGRLAHARLYRQALTPDEIQSGIAADLPVEQVGRPSPLEFSLHNDQEQQVLYTPLPGRAAADDAGQQVHLIATNTSGSALTLIRPEIAGRPVSASDHHFEIRFRPGTINKPESILPANALWQAGFAAHSDGTVSLYLRHQTGANLGPGEAMIVSLQGLRVNAAGGSRGTRIQIKYRQIIPAGSAKPLTGSRLQYLSVLQRSESAMESKLKGLETAVDQWAADRDQSQSAQNDVAERLEALHTTLAELATLAEQSPGSGPLTAGIIGSDHMVNDGRSLNNLTIFIEMMAADDPIELHVEETLVTLRFPIFVEGERLEGLALPQELAGQNVQFTQDSDLKPSGETADNALSISDVTDSHFSFSFELKYDMTVEAGNGRRLVLPLSGLTSSAPSGPSWVEVVCENFGLLGKRTFRLPLEKGPAKAMSSDDGLGLSVSHRLQLWKNPVILFRNEILNESNEQVEDPDATIGLDQDGILEIQSPAGLTLQSDSAVTIASNDSINLNCSIQVQGRIKDETGWVMPKGAIIMWTGKTAPEGWTLCDGTEGAPDLRSRFIIGAGPGNTKEKLSAYPLYSKGGQEIVTLTEKQMPLHDHPITDPGHQHTYNGAIGFGHGFETQSASYTPATSNPDQKTDNKKTGITLGQTGGNEPVETRPPYFALAFIMKL
ncbi:MAG: tail fiber protein [Chloroflexi bacterium]|nr:tail fiber protein [Chloroflexota bacterium]